MTIPIPSPHSSQKQQTFLALAPLLFEFSRLLSIVPAIFGTLWNLYYTFQPPDGTWGWSAEYAISVLWVSDYSMADQHAVPSLIVTCAVL